MRKMYNIYDRKNKYTYKFNVSCINNYYFITY